MINQIEVPMYLEETLPEISKDLHNIDKADTYRTINALTGFTCEQIQEHNFQAVKKCFAIADKLYSKGNKTVQNAIQNVFVYSFTRIFNNYPADKQVLQAMIPIGLYSLYVVQLYQKGC